MKKIYAILACIIMVINAYATEQIPDRLLANDTAYKIGSYTYIMEDYFKSSGIKKPPSASTALWRGYIAEFEIIDGKLYCKDFYHEYYDDTQKLVKLEGLKKDGENIFCDWFTKKDIQLIEKRPYPESYMLEENSYKMDVENGYAKIRLARHTPEKRFSYEDLDRRAGTPYIPENDNLDSWVELWAVFIGQHGFGLSQSTDIDTAKNILAKQSVKTRAIIKNANERAVSMLLPMTRTTMPTYYNEESTLPDLSSFIGKAVEVEIENPLTIDAKITSVRELEKWESIHNINSKEIRPIEHGESYALYEAALKLYPKIRLEDFNDVEIKFSVDGNFKVKVSRGNPGKKKWKYPYPLYKRISDVSQSDVEMRYPAKTLKDAKFMLCVEFYDNQGIEDFSKFENWNFPKKIYLNGTVVWEYDKEENKIFKFVTGQDTDLSKFSEEEILETLYFLMRKDADETTSGRAKFEAVCDRAFKIDFRQHPKHCNTPLYLLNCNLDKERIAKLADKLEETYKTKFPFNRDFVESEAFLDTQKRNQKFNETRRMVYEIKL